jgi:hypothetical protein
MDCNCIRQGCEEECLPPPAEGKTEGVDRQDSRVEGGICHEQQSASTAVREFRRTAVPVSG